MNTNSLNFEINCLKFELNEEGGEIHACPSFDVVEEFNRSFSDKTITNYIVKSVTSDDLYVVTKIWDKENTPFANFVAVVPFSAKKYEDKILIGGIEYYYDMWGDIRTEHCDDED